MPQNPNDDDCGQQSTEPILIDSSAAHSESSSASSDEPALAAAAPATPTSATFEQKSQEQRLTPIKKCHSEARFASSDNKRQSGFVAESGSAPSSFRHRNKPAKLSLCGQPQQQQQQQQHLQQPQVASKQLAIYINGKIRSNSIFCQSSSAAAAGSIGGLFNRAFHHASSRPGAKSRQEERGAGGTINKNQFKVENEESCAASLKHEREEKQENFKLNQRSSGKGFFHNYLSVAGGELKRTRKRKRSSKFSLIKRADKTRESPSSSPSSSSSELAGQEDEEAHTEDRKSEKLSLQASSSFSLTTKEQQLREPTTPTSYKLNPSSMFLRKAMRYYRLWIYCTNITILIGTLIFILSTIYVTSDYRFKLLVSPSPSFVSTATTTSSPTLLAKESAFHAARTPTSSDQSYESADRNNYNNAKLNYIESIKTEEAKEQKVEESTYDIHIKYTEPSVLIAYAVIAIQAGILQAIGCFGAIRMKERWIQTFWYLILALTVFDVVFLLYWLNRYDFIVKSLHHHMSLRLNQHYGEFYTGVYNHTLPNAATAEAANTLLGSQTYYSASNEPVESRKFLIPADIEANLDKTLTVSASMLLVSRLKR